MKTCPNCGAKMGANVNFCTNCGTSLKNVPLDPPKFEKPAQPVQPPKPSQPADQTEPAQTKQTQSAQPQPSRVAREQAPRPQADQTKIAAANYWQWLVHSWKKPAAWQKAESWYGFVTLLAEDILLLLFLSIGVGHLTSNAGSQYGEVGSMVANQVNQLSGTVIFQLFFMVLLMQIISLAAGFGARQFIFGQNLPVMTFVNRTVQASNLSVILVLLACLCLMVGDASMIASGLVLGMIASVLFNLGLIVVTLDGQKPVRDKFYGLLILTVAVILASMILSSLFGSAVYNQIKDLIGNSLFSQF